MDLNHTIAALSCHAHPNEDVTARPTIVADRAPEHGFDRSGVGGSLIGSPPVNGIPITLAKRSVVDRCWRVRFTGLKFGVGAGRGRG